MNHDKITQEILQQFKTLEQADTSEWDQTHWTSEVLTALCVAGRRLGCSVWAAHVDKQLNDGGEWLYDVTWCEYDDPNSLKSGSGGCRV